ncbi:MAG TPA: cupin domain-containing protein [Acidobacteriota bacterium]|nr:cupin domain-containing protein [Acidobacteriota bacterium]
MSAEETVAPTYLYRHIPKIQEQATGVTSPTCHYRPIFGEGDSETRIVRGVSRFGEVTVDPGGTCELVNYPREEEIYLMLEGKGVLHYGGAEHRVRKHDYMYLAPGVSHGIANDADVPIRFLVFGYRLPKDLTVAPTEGLQLANLDEVPLQTVGGHPPDCQYRLLMGNTESKRDRLASAHILTSLFVMEFTPGGTNFPHHHEREEEIYFLLSGEGEMVAGGGLTGVEGRHPAKAGDAYFFRLNCTAGFYATKIQSSEKARILAARSLFPGMK